MTALLVVDLQNDFFSGGALAVPCAEEILPTVNALLDLPFDVIVATQDFHPATHESFAASHQKPVGTVINLRGMQQVLWPTHCVENTPGVDFAPGWNASKIDQVIHKGTDPTVDSYSAFFDNAHKCSTGLESFLKSKNITTLVIVGLATDYCVKFSALDALKIGFIVIVLPEGCRGVNINPHDSALALEEMKKAGAIIATLTEVKGLFCGGQK